MAPYRLPDGYRRNVRPVDWDDHAPVAGHTAGWEWQPDVYPHAVARARMLSVTRIVDVGCGAGRKIAPYCDEFDVVGIDRPEIVDRIDLRGEWIAHDLEADEPLPCDVDGALIVCSDVIEHLVRPENLAAALLDTVEHGGAELVVLSTPDRKRTRGPRDTGPPANRHHVQEWNLEELVMWLEGVGFDVDEAGFTRSNDHEPALATCLLELTA